MVLNIIIHSTLEIYVQTVLRDKRLRYKRTDTCFNTVHTQVFYSPACLHA